VEIEPEMIHPILQRPVSELLDEVDRSEIKLFT
jgi:hypothetical protein